MNRYVEHCKSCSFISLSMYICCKHVSCQASGLPMICLILILCQVELKSLWCKSYIFMHWTLVCPADGEGVGGGEECRYQADSQILTRALSLKVRYLTPGISLT